MSHHQDLAKSENDFADIRQTASHGAEYWMARDLQPLLGYKTWENFQNAIRRAQASCKEFGQDVDDHFREVTKMIEAGKGARKRRKDYMLSRYASYLIAMNGDPEKRPIALAQNYFYIQTRRQEQQEKRTYVLKRVELRDRLTESTKRLNEAAQDAGIDSGKAYAIFHDQGYRGLYGGLSLREIKERKNLSENDTPADFMGVTELAANDFRATQTEERLRRERTKGFNNACDVHLQVGKRVRNTILAEGNTPPEDLEAEENIQPALKKWRKGKLRSNWQDGQDSDNQLGQ